LGLQCSLYWLFFKEKCVVLCFFYIATFFVQLQAFFLEANRILKPGGMLTIVTDNLWYGKLLMRLVAGISVDQFAYVSSDDSTKNGAVQYCLQSASAPEARRAAGVSAAGVKGKNINNSSSSSSKKTQQNEGHQEEVEKEDTSAALAPLESEWTLQDSEGDVLLYVGKPGAAAGHIVEASSYFDR
jgi:hypothetical protein